MSCLAEWMMKHTLSPQRSLMTDQEGGGGGKKGGGGGEEEDKEEEETPSWLF